MNNLQLATHFFLQLATILVCCRLVGLLAKRFGQPQVVAEMIAGVLLGPSFFGWVSPEAQAFLFPWDRSQLTRDTQTYLYPAAQVGLALYMFVVGLEFRLDLVRKKISSSLAVSLAGIVAPFVLGGALGWVLFRTTNLFPARTSLPEAMLFLAASMCITAFPVLARIIHAKKLTGTTMGTVALGAGAIDDVVAWCLLALVLASGDHHWSHAFLNIAGGAAYVVVTWFLVRPFLLWAKTRLIAQNTLTDAGLVWALALLAVGAWFTDAIGLHAVFGAFVMGAAMPRGVISRDLILRIQPLTVVLLLPLFFTYSGLNTRFGLLESGWHWAICALVLFVAILGKGAACWLAARATGIPHREALGIGTLMNARGLMELIIINIGLQRGIISEALFATLVIMALITTLMTSPVFDWVMGRNPRTSEEVPTPPAEALEPFA